MPPVWTGRLRGSAQWLKRMIREAAAYVSTLGYQKLYIMSGETGLYEKYGFVKLGDYETIYGDTDQLFVMNIGQTLINP